MPVPPKVFSPFIVSLSCCIGFSWGQTSAVSAFLQPGLTYNVLCKGEYTFTTELFVNKAFQQRLLTGRIRRKGGQGGGAILGLLCISYLTALLCFDLLHT